MEQKSYVLRKTQTSVGCRAEPSRSSARFYIGALCNSAIKLAAPKRRAAFFFVCALTLPAAVVPLFWDFSLRHPTTVYIYQTPLAVLPFNLKAKRHAPRLRSFSAARPAAKS